MPLTRTRVCVHAIRTPAEALSAADAGADAVGFIFHASSARNIEPEAAWRIAAVLPPFVATVGVYTNASVDAYLDLEERCPTDYSQFHGQEDVETVKQCGTRAVKTVWYDAGNTERDAAGWLEVDEVDAVLVAFKPGQGGAAKDWIGEVRRVVALGEEAGKAVMLGGGITAETAAEVIRAVGPWAVCVSGGVEGADGYKDPAKMAAFVRAVRAADEG